MGARVVAVIKQLGRILAWPFTGEIQHPRPSHEEIEERLRTGTLANRDQSGGGGLG